MSFDLQRSRSKLFLLFKSPYYNFLFDIRLHGFWGLTFDLWKSSGVKKKLYHSKAHIWLPIWLLWTPCISLSCTVFELFDFKIFRVRPWPLTSDLWRSSGVEKIILFQSPYMTSYFTSIDTISLSRAVFDIFDFKVFRVWPWPLTPKGHLGSNFSIPFESPHMTSYLTSIDNISLFRTVFEIFDFKVFRVWPLTPESHLGWTIFIPFESPYMTSYLTSMDNISLSRTVFEIFDFKVFRVWPWPSTPNGELGSKKKLYHLKAHIWLPIWLLWTAFLYLVPFSRY